jgi:hypothetical protein
VQYLDDGKIISTNSNVNIPNNVFAVGQNFSIYNNSNSSISIIPGGLVSIIVVGTTTTGTRTLTVNGFATLIAVSSNVFIISGGGIS